MATTVAVLLDGVTVCTASDARFGNGKVGVGSRNDGASFDDLRVYVRDEFTTGTSEPTASNTGLKVNGFTTADLTITRSSANGDLLVDDAWVASHGTTQTIRGVSTKVIDKIWVKGFLSFTATSPVLFVNSQFGLAWVTSPMLRSTRIGFAAGRFTSSCPRRTPASISATR